MSRVLDLRVAEIPELTLTLLDPEATTLHVVAPDEALINELEHMHTSTLQQMAKGDQNSIALIYDLTARLLSSNKENLQVTVEDLRGKYRIKWQHLLLIISDYMAFIDDIKNEKN